MGVHGRLQVSPVNTVRRQGLRRRRRRRQLVLPHVLYCCFALRPGAGLHFGIKDSCRDPSDEDTRQRRPIFAD
jgi:hypothetical protein